MPRGFDKCVRNGGKVYTIKPSADTYQHMCTSHGHTYAGHIKHDKPKPSPHHHSKTK